MHSTFFLASALAICAIAGPVQKRAVVTETAVIIKTVTATATITRTVSGTPKPEHGHHGFQHGFQHGSDFWRSSHSGFHSGAISWTHSRNGAHPHNATRTRSHHATGSGAGSHHSTRSGTVPRHSTIRSETAPHHSTMASATSTRTPSPTTKVSSTASTQKPSTTSITLKQKQKQKQIQKQSAAPTSSQLSAGYVVAQEMGATTASKPTSEPAPVSTKDSHLTGEIQATLQSGPDYQAAVLYHHNAVRANHNSAPLVWDAACEEGARRTAERCIWEHPADILGELNQGQNLFTTSGTSYNVTAAITESWYKSEWAAMVPYIGQADVPDDVFHEVGHLTQLVWRKTTKVGCVSYDCAGRMKFSDGTPTKMDKLTVCNYAEPGNYGGQFASNVGLTKSPVENFSWTD